jgi:polyisoprenoid-binding protein YceI
MAAAPGHYRFGPHNGRLLLDTGRQGLAAALGHDLTLEVTAWSAEVDVGADRATSRVSARFDLGSLSVVDGRGGATPLTSGNRREIESNARKVLEVERFPEGVFESTTIGEASSPLILEGTLTLRGRTGSQQVELEETAPDRYRAHGTIVQSRFGIKPYSAAFGTLKVRDDVAFQVEVSIEA